MASTPLNRFLADFVLPLVAGGRVLVSGLIGPGMLARFAYDPLIDATLAGKIAGEMRVQLARIGPVGPIDALPADGLALAAVWHNLLAMTHPEASGRAGLCRRVREWSARMLQWAEAPRTAQDVALRHAMLGRLGEVGRVDTDVTFWAGSARYVGVAPPARLVAWKSVRRVRELKTRVPLFDLLSTLRAEDPAEDLIEPARVALALSPLTDLLLIVRPALTSFRWTSAAVNALADGALRGAAVRILLARGAGERSDAPPARLRAAEEATRRAVSDGLPAGAAQLLLALHLELLVTDALGRGQPAPGHALGWDALARLGAERAARMVGLELPVVERALALETQARAVQKDAPAAALLARAGFVEVST